jgi:hypothetical protein
MAPKPRVVDPWRLASGAFSELLKKWLAGMFDDLDFGVSDGGLGIQHLID